MGIHLQKRAVTTNRPACRLKPLALLSFKDGSSPFFFTEKEIKEVELYRLENSMK